MFYYIDGYNLLFRVLRGGENLKQEREQLIKDLESKINLLEMEAALVFDSQYTPDEGSSSHYKRLQLIFTGTGETADEYILKRLKEALFPNQITVVTSDKRLASQCRRRLARVEDVLEFRQLLNRRYKNKLEQRTERQKKVSPPPVQAPPKMIKPLKTSSLEECRDYYLEIFEKELSELSEKTPPTKGRAKKDKKPKPPPLSNEEQQLSDMERWQKIFERKLPKDEGHSI